MTEFREVNSGRFGTEEDFRLDLEVKGQVDKDVTHSPVIKVV
jgi:hypothetical protein